jgi:predicted amidophosphoribosyltransferase
MPTVAELTAPYGNFMVGPRRGGAVCGFCFNLTDAYSRCYPCAHGERWVDAMCPVSYSIGHEQLHHVLRGYKRRSGATAARFTVELAAVLWRHLEAHERCVAHAAGAGAFELVTCVPSGERERERHHPLCRIVGELAAPTRARYERLLRRSAGDSSPHVFDGGKYETTRELDGSSVLLIDDMWTTGANAQSAAAALKKGGARTVAVVVIGRHLNRDWHENDRRLRSICGAFDWSSCALCASDTKMD